MTVSSEVTRNAYVGGAAQTVFDYTFKIYQESDLKVFVNGAEVVSGFTVSGVGDDAGGQVTFGASQEGNTVVFVSDYSYNQLLDLVRYGILDAEAVEGGFDKNTRLILQLVRQLAGKVGVSDDSGTTGIVIPEPSTGKFLRWTASGTLENVTLQEVNGDLFQIGDPNDDEILVWNESSGYFTPEALTAHPSIVAIQAGLDAVTPPYAQIATATNLAKSTRYRDFGQALTHVLPDGATLSFGDYVDFRMAVNSYTTIADGNVTTINAHANDGGGEVARFSSYGDGAVFRWSTSGWLVEDARETFCGIIRLDSDEDVLNGASENVFNTTKSSVVQDIGGLAGVNGSSRFLDIDFDAIVAISAAACVSGGSSDDVNMAIRLDGSTDILFQQVLGSSYPPTSIDGVFFDASTYPDGIEVVTQNESGGTRTMEGNPAAYTTYFTWRINRMR